MEAPPFPNLFQVDDLGCFYVQYGKVATYTEAYQIKDNNQMMTYLSPGRVKTDDFLYKIESDGTAAITDTPISSEIGEIKVLAVMPFSDNSKIAMLTDTPTKSTLTDASHAVKYNKTHDGGAGEEVMEKSIRKYSLVYVEQFNAETNDGNRKWFYCNDNAMQTYDYPGNDQDFMRKVISITYTDDTGSMLVKDWNGHSGAIAPYSSTSLCYLSDSNNSPLYCIDGLDLSFTEKSKVRWLKNLSSQDQKLFLTDTGNNRVVKLSTDFGQANSFTVNAPIDIAQTASKYVFTLSESTTGDEGAINLFEVTGGSATKACEAFGKLVTDASKKNDTSYRAGKLMNPRAIYFYAQPSGNNFIGGLVILEDGCDNHKNRVQIIRTNMSEWIE